MKPCTCCGGERFVEETQHVVPGVSTCLYIIEKCKTCGQRRSNYVAVRK